MSDYVHPRTLVDAGWVAQHIDDANVRLIDGDEDATAGTGRGRTSSGIRRWRARRQP